MRIIDKNGEVEYLFFKSPQEVDFKAMLAGIEKIKNNQLLSRDLIILEDARDAKAHLSLEEVDQLLELMSKTANKYNSIKHAVIHNNPESTAIALLFEHRITNPNYKLRVFYTEEAATQWLGIIHEFA